jgi:glutathione S-transferase
MADMTKELRVFGAQYSVYVRIVRLTLAEKGIEYQLVPVDIFAETGPPPGYLERHPFGRIPAFDHDGFSLYETGAITRYIDDVFHRPRLQPPDVRERARCNQLMSIVDNYHIPNWCGGFTWNGSRSRRGAAPPTRPGLRPPFRKQGPA